MVTHRETVNGAARQLDDLADELVPDDERAVMATDRVRCVDREHDRAGLVFGRVRAADSAAQHLDEGLAVARCRERNRVDAYVAAAVENGRTHGLR